MAFDPFETSQESSQPVEAFKFTLGGEIFRYTSAEDEINIGGEFYSPQAISRDKIENGAEAEQRTQVLNITLPGSNELVTKYLSIVPSETAAVEVFRVQRLDFPAPEAVLLFEGIIHSVTFESDGLTAKVATRPTAAATSREVPRFTYSNLCNNVLYDARCKVVENDPAYQYTTGTVSGTDENTVTVSGTAAFGDGHFTAGFIDVDGELRLILDHTGNDLELLLPFGTDPTGKTPIVQAGCDHSIQTCKAKFDNVINYGGFAFVPLKDVFKNGLV